MVLVPVLLLVALAVGIGYFRLQQGPVAINFLVDPIRQGIDRGLPGLAARFDDVILTLADSGGLELRLRNLSLADGRGDIVIAAPQAAIGLDAGSLWQFTASPNRVELIEPRIAVVYTKQSGFSLNFSDASAQGAAGEAPEGGVIARRAIAASELQNGRGIDLAALVRTGAAASGANKSTLREVGLRNATVLLDSEGRRSFWQVPRLLVDVEHRTDRSVVSGSARVSSSGRIWTASFRLDAEGSGGGLNARLSLRDVVPRDLASTLPGGEGLALLEQPVSADIAAALQDDGSVTDVTMALELSGSRLRLRDTEAALLVIDKGLMNLRYNTRKEQLLLEPSRLQSGSASFVMDGSAQRRVAAGSAAGEAAWDFEARVLPEAQGGEDAGGLGLSVVRGSYVEKEHTLRVSEVQASLAGGRIAMSGEIDVGAAAGGVRWDGEFSGMPVAQLAAIWPNAVAPTGRRWLSDNVRAGRVTSGKILYRSGRFLPAASSAAEQPPWQFEIDIGAEGVMFDPLAGLAPVTAERATARYENDRLQVDVPDGLMDLGDGDEIQFKDGRFVGSEMLGGGAAGEVIYKFQGPAPAMRKLMESEPLQAASRSLAGSHDIDGMLAGETRIGFPLADIIEPDQIGYQITARLSEGRIRGLLEGEDVKGASLDFEATPTAVSAKGEVLVKGVLAKLNMQRLVREPEDRQPPLRLSARLDSADRKQLGLDVDGIISGDTPIELTVERFGLPDQRTHVRVDLTPATVSLPALGWTKPAGRQAFLDADVEPSNAKGERRLSGVQVAGSDIAIEGAVQLDKDGKAKDFSFPVFSLDIVSRLSIAGRKQGNGVWAVNVDGRTLQARGFFRSLFKIDTAAQGRDRQRNDDSDEGYDVVANIDNVIGFDEISLRKLELKSSTRGGKMTALSGRGTLDGGQPMAFELRGGLDGSSRRLLVDTTDAGAAFKLVGVYPNMVGGRLRLEVDLDGSGPAEKVGTLWVERFQVLGDAVVSEVIGSSDESVPAIGRKRRVVRQKFEFDSLRAPFSVGHGQLVLEDAALHGQLLGATLRGKADFERKTVDLGGTYVFLQGLNNVFAAIPLLGDLLSGPRKEGIFGTNYAIRGSMDRPQVYVNPLSAIAPGIFREIFQLAPNGQRVSPRTPEGLTDGQGKAGSSGVTVSPGRTIEGWRSKTLPN